MIDRSLSGIRSENPGILISRRRPLVLTSVMDTGANPIVFSRDTTADWLEASIRPLISLPLASRIAYSKTLASAATSCPLFGRPTGRVRLQARRHALGD